MSTRSYDGPAQDKRMSRYRVTDEDVFKFVHTLCEFTYADQVFTSVMLSASREFPPLAELAKLTGLRILAHIMTAKAPEPVTTPSEGRDKDYVARMSGVLSSSVHSVISLGDLFKDSMSSKSVKFPEKMVKVLEARLQSIAMGKDST
jgi:hypothetical protein